MWILAASSAFASVEKVVIPADGLELAARLYRPDGAGSFPAIILLHGCSGMWARNGEPTGSYDFWARHFQQRGYHALLLDSFGPRGEKEICTQKRRRVSPERERSRDAHAALRWLASRDDVEAKSIHILGWSNGAMTVLQALRQDAEGKASDMPEFRSAVAFYPGCASLLRGKYAPDVPLLIQAGAEDDWTPARHCQGLAKRAREGGAKVEIDVYDGAHHSFDRMDGRVRYRPDVSNPSSPTGWGATVGPNPEARQKAIERTTRFIEAHR